MKVEEIVKHVRNLSGYKFLFNHEELKTAGTKSVKFDRLPIQDVMNEVLKGTGLTYRIEKEVIVIYPSTEKVQDEEKKSFTVKGKVVDEKRQPLPGLPSS